jgi:MFS family permease
MRRLMVMVSAIVLVDTMFYAAISPLLPYYAHHFHLAKSQAGLLAASYAAGTLVGSIPAGWLAVRLGVRATIVAGLTLMIAASFAFGFARQVAVLDAARFVQGLGGAASWAAGLAWLMDRVSPGRRAEVIGTTLSAAIVGALLGPVLGTAAAQTSPRLVFSLVGVLGVGLVLSTLLEPGHAPGPGTPELRALWPALRERHVLAGGWLTMLGALLYGTMGVLVPLRLNRLGATNLVIGAAFLVGAALAGLSSPVAGRLADQRGWRVPVLAGICVSTLWVVLLPAVASVPLLFALVALADPTFGAVYPAAGSMLSRGAERAALGQAYAFGLFNLTWAGGQVVGSAGSAAIAQATADAVPYALLAGLCILTAAAIATELRSGPRQARHSRH